MNKTVSVILPTYNEKDNVVALICQLNECLDNGSGELVEFIVVDDDSPDETWKCVQDAFSHDQRVKVIRRRQVRGLTSAIWEGIVQAKGDIVAWLDCDFSMPPAMLAVLVDNVREGWDVAVGSRFIKGSKGSCTVCESVTAAAMSRILNGFIAIVLGPAFKDYTSGFAAARKKVFKDIKLKGDYGEYFIDFIYSTHRQGYKIIELPYQCLPRRAGYSKTGRRITDFLKKGWKYIVLTLRLKFIP